MIITDSPNSVRRVLRYIDVCIILHNLLLELGDEQLPREWYEGWEVQDVVGDVHYERILQGSSTKDGRRQWLLDYLRDYVYHN